MSMTLQIFCAWRSDSEPPNTVKSWLKTKTSRPLIVPEPVTTPSPGMRCVVHAEVDAVVLDVHVELLEAAFVEQDLEPLARGQLALGVLRVDPLLPPPSRAAARRLSISAILADMRATSLRCIA